ncbi:YolD-like family protein [Mesobacillus zeae]|nr:YolD-like family protein [Mesobacillus zeae]
MPEHRTLLHELAIDELRQAKPLLDEYQITEMESCIAYSMEFNFPLIIRKWTDGFTCEEKGRAHFIDHVRKEVRLKTKDGVVVRVAFADIVGVKVVE